MLRCVFLDHMLDIKISDNLCQSAPRVNPNPSGWFYYDPEEMTYDEAKQRLLACVIRRYDTEIEAKKLARQKLKDML